MPGRPARAGPVPQDGDGVEGPFDIEDFEDHDTAAVGRLDLGSVLVPMPEAGQVQVEVNEVGAPSAVWVVTPNGRFTIAAYAAPKSAGLWREVAAELAEALRKDTPNVSIESGPWGREVVGIGEGRGAFHRRRRIPLDDPLRRQRCAGDHRRAGRRGAKCLERTPSFAAVIPRFRCARRCRCNCPSRWPPNCGPPRPRPSPRRRRVRRSRVTRRPPRRRSRSRSRRRALRPAQRAGLGDAAAARCDRRLSRVDTSSRAARHAVPSAPGVRADLGERHRPQRRVGRRGHPLDTHLQRVDRIVGRRRDAHRHRQRRQLTARRRHVLRGLRHRVGQIRPLTDPRPGQLLGQPRRTRFAHPRDGGGQAVAAQLVGGLPSRPAPPGRLAARRSRRAAPPARPPRARGVPAPTPRPPRRP